MMAPYGRGSTDSNLTLYPVDWPSCSARSVDTRSATETALIRRGCVHTMLQCAPEPLLTHSSRMYWHTCVVLPQPVLPRTSVTGCSLIVSRIWVRKANIGSSSRFLAAACSSASVFWRSAQSVLRSWQMESRLAVARAPSSMLAPSHGFQFCCGGDQLTIPACCGVLGGSRSS